MRIHAIGAVTLAYSRRGTFAPPLLFDLHNQCIQATQEPRLIQYTV